MNELKFHCPYFKSPSLNLTSEKQNIRLARKNKGWDHGNGCTTLSIYLMALNCMLKSGKEKKVKKEARLTVPEGSRGTLYAMGRVGAVMERVAFSTSL